MFHAAKDALSSQAARSYVNGLIKRYGEVRDLKIDSKEKTVVVVCILEGEPEPVKVRIDRYRIESELGAGGMAIVYLAEDMKHRRRVAIKVLREELTASVGSARFLREIEIAASLVHPNILSLHDSGEANGLLYYVMPYVEGESLRDRLRRDGRLELATAVRIATEIADALEHAHRHGVVHRDIKPENILFEADHPVVTDFGVARAVSIADSRGEAVTATGVVIGSPAYMSPEQALGERDLDSRTDVYSLGCVVYEMLTGQRPFVAPTVQALIARKLRGESPGVRSIARAIPDEVERVILKAMAASAQDRYLSVKEFASELQRAASGGRTVRPRQWPAFYWQAASVALVTTLVLAATVVWRKRSAATPIRSLAVLPFTSSPDSTPPHIIEGMHDEIIAELGALPTIRVISRTSVLPFRQSKKTISEIARELDVDAVVEGGFYWMTDSVRLQVRLVRAVPEERQLWSRAFVTDVRHLMTLHTNVAAGIAEQLNVALGLGAPGNTAEDARAAVNNTARNPVAQELFSLSRYWLNRRTAEGLVKSRAFLRQSIAVDSEYAPSHALLAQALAMAVDWHYERLDPIETSRAAIEAANRALGLDSTNADALASRGRVLSAVHAPPAMIRADFERAISLAPQHANAHGWYAMELAWRGQGAASRRENEIAVAIDPLAPGRRMGFAISALNYGSPEEALRHARHAIEREPTLPHPRSAEALALLLLNRPSDCVDVDLEQFVAIRALCLHTLGKRSTAQRLIDSLAALANAATRAGGPYADIVIGENIALYYAWTGNVDATLLWLRRAADITTAAAPFLYLNSKIFDPVRADPRFRDGVESLKAEIWTKVSSQLRLPRFRDDDGEGATEANRNK